MNPSLRKTSIWLLLLLLPVAGYIVFEFSSLTEAEEEIEAIYDRQLEAVLFSANLYSSDLANSIARRVEEAAIESLSIQEIFEVNPFLTALYFPSFEEQQSALFFPKDYTADAIFLDSLNKFFLRKGEKRVNNLQRYRQSGYLKLEPLGTTEIENRQLSTLFFVRKDVQSSRPCLLVFEPEAFIDQILVPKVQELGQEDFILQINRADTDSVIWEQRRIEGDNQEIKVREALWLLPEYAVGIAPSGQTLEDIVRTRMIYNVGAILLLTLCFFIGVGLLIRNVQKALNLAQKKSVFVSNVSHELRTPLALISMFAETLEMGRVPSEEKKKEYYGIIHRETQRLGNIVNRILNFAQVEAKKKTYNFESIDLPEVVGEVLDTYAFHLKQHGFEWKYQPEENLPLLQADREAVMEAVVNLLDNAIKYSPKEKEVNIRIKKEIQGIFVEVEDRGMGIASGQQKVIFEQFYRVSRGDLHPIKGSGLGLSIVQHIMEAHQGRVEVRSELGKGSCFRLWFPISHE